ncbi:hypothetical protein KO500_07235 [Cellulophaga baltica]|uniref:hypothetical protein n=1 Tax=Cellulophaga TaxID=104264 RepID=UPI001C070F66|nr:MULTISPECIES: hypothetical protein [Cellulophaga]MBU2996221.1 hypothetical protein [Cellulophaga baltica]MDO6767616.1 hypothetical protein [Cellulophaga sp. 1_MG-2023]
MKFIRKLFSFKRLLITSIILLLVLNVFSFYGLYTHKFYLLEYDNYIFPILSIVHFVYLYALWFKTNENEPPDLPMRNTEYTLYFVFLIYVFKFLESIYILSTYDDFKNHYIPDTFLPIGISLVVLYFFLLLITLVAFYYRKEKIGGFNFEDYNDIDSWK